MRVKTTISSAMSRPPVVGGDGATITAAFRHLCSWENLMLAWRKAARGKRGTASVARFEYRAEEQLSEIREQLLAGTYRPGCYVHFHIKDPKRRKISAIRFRDRVVHHALCNVIEPRFERLFIPDSYANRKGKGTHRAVDRLQGFAQRYRYVLRADIVQHFASVDHAILLDILRRRIPEADVMRLVETIVASGRGVLDDEYRYVRFPGDDLLAICRPRGLPIGNLTSQFWSNCYLHPFDQFVTRELGCRAYLRYVGRLRAVRRQSASSTASAIAAAGRSIPDRAQVLPVRRLRSLPTRLVKARKVRSAPAMRARLMPITRRDQLRRHQHPGLDQPRRADRGSPHSWTASRPAEHRKSRAPALRQRSERWATNTPHENRCRCSGRTGST